MKKDNSEIGATAAMRVAQELRRRILEGEFKPGQRLKIDELASLLRISHMPVRVALQTLESEGILEVFPHRGTIVRGVDEPFIRNLYDVRGAIEGLLAERCAAMVDKKGSSALKRAALMFEKAAAKNDKYALMRTNLELHETISGVVRNPEANRVLSQGRLLVEALRVRFGYHPVRVHELLLEHRELVDAIVDRKIARAGEIARRHCELGRDDLISLLNKE